MFTDISSEMVTAILPLYLTLVLHLTPLQFGLVDGLQQGLTALLRMAAGITADRGQRYKQIATIGYGLSAVGKGALALAGTTISPVLVAVVLDRVGKGIRTAPRDALITHSASPTRLGEAFGVHRSLDTAGALLGPIMAFAILALVPGRFDAIFVVSVSAAVIGLAVLILFVENRVTSQVADGQPISLRGTLALLIRPRFRGLLAAGVALNSVTMSDSFIYLTFQRRSALDVEFFPLLYVGTALVYLVLAVPAGRLADRYGRREVFLGGYLSLLAAYGLLLLPQPGVIELTGCLVLLGAYYAATDGVLMALATTMLPPPMVASGLSLLTTATTLMRLASAVSFGALWAWRGPEVAVAFFAVALAAAVIAARMLVAPPPDGGSS